MKVKRIVSNISANNTDDVKSFYQQIFGLEMIMDLGWVKTFSSGEQMDIQISVASEGGSGTVVPDISIEVDDLDVAIERVKAGNIHFEYGPVSEPWGVRRFYIRDPFGKLINVLQHE